MTVITILFPVCEIYSWSLCKKKKKKDEKERKKGVAPVCTVVVISLMPILYCHLAFDLDYYCCIRHCWINVAVQLCVFFLPTGDNYHINVLEIASSCYKYILTLEQKKIYVHKIWTDIFSQYWKPWKLSIASVCFILFPLLIILVNSTMMEWNIEFKYQWIIYFTIGTG